MESLFVLSALIYIIFGFISLGVNRPTFGRIIGKFLYLSGMFLIGAFIFVIFVDEAPVFGSFLSMCILGISLWWSYKW